MADLVRILSRPIGDEINSVDARELHQALESRADFSTWIRERAIQLDLENGKDFAVFHQTGENGGRPRAEWIVTLDAAKHIAMMERTETGKRVRSYFIEAEKRLRSVISDPIALLSDPATLRGLLGSYAERVQALEATVAEQAPKVEVYDRIIDCGDTFGFREACQQIRAATGDNENRVRGFMRERGWIQKLGNGLAPAHVGVNRGYVTTRERSWTDAAGASHVRPELRVTPKGVAKAIELLLASEAAE